MDAHRGRGRAIGRLGFHVRVAATTAAVAALAVALVVTSFRWRVGNVLGAAIEQRAADVASASAAALRAGDRDAAEACVEGLAARVPELVHASVRDARGAVLAERGQLSPGAAIGSAELPGGGRVEVALDRRGVAAEARGLTLRAAAFGLAVLAFAASVGAWLARRLTRPVAPLAEAAARLAQGDLSVAVPRDAPDEMGTLADGLAEMSASLRGMVVDLRGAAGELGRHADDVARNAREGVSRATGQVSAMEVATGDVAGIAAGSRQANEAAQRVIDVAVRSRDVWKDGERAVHEAIAGLEALHARVEAIALAVTELSERTVAVAGTISTLRDLADRSNVLALNASIEASKVGAEGAGFGVVAGEMRRLAEGSRRATETVRGALVELQRATRQVVATTGEGSDAAQRAVRNAERARVTIAGLATAIEDSSVAASAIAETTRGQTDDMERVATTVGWLQGQMGETLGGAQRLEQAARALAAVAARLDERVAAYRVDA